MPNRTDISPILVMGTGLTPSPRRGEGWGEGALRVESNSEGPIASQQKFLPDRLQYAFGVGEHFVVPEAQYAIAVFLDYLRPRRIARRVLLSTVQLDCQPGRAAGKVSDIGIDLQLADELLPFEPARPEVEPKTLFSIRLVGAQSACDRSQAFLSQLSTPSPNPLPAGERAQDCIARA